LTAQFLVAEQKFGGFSQKGAGLVAHNPTKGRQTVYFKCPNDDTHAIGWDVGSFLESE